MTNKLLGTWKLVSHNYEVQVTEADTLKVITPWWTMPDKGSTRGVLTLVKSE